MRCWRWYTLLSQSPHLNSLSVGEEDALRVVAIRETIRLMGEIDRTMLKWPVG